MKAEDLIRNEISKAIARLGGGSDLIGTINSWGKEIPDEDIYRSLQSWNLTKLKEKREELSALELFYK
jgi:hypothetical protein